MSGLYEQTARSRGFRQIPLSFMRTTQPCLPANLSHSTSSTVSSRGTP